MSNSKSQAGTKAKQRTKAEVTTSSSHNAKPNVSGSLRIDLKKIGQFLKIVDGAEYLYMRHCMGMRDSIQNLIKRHEISKTDFCKKFQIKPAKYQDYIMGNYNYSVHDMACLNAAFMELEVEKLKDEVPVQIAKG